MAGIEECKALCDDKKFLAVLDVARGNLGMQSRLAHDPLTADPIRRHRFIGLVVRKDKSGEYKLGTIGTDAWDGRECFQNGFVCTWQDIFQEAAIVAAAPPSYRLTSIMGRTTVHDCKQLSRKTQTPVFLIGTGMDALKSVFFCDENTFKRFK
uniref:hypothetical protein n=1 Tax=Rheinheimera sp. TaxID=1869214 RepID=UPI0040472374